MTIYTFPESLWHIASLSFSLRSLSSSSAASSWNQYSFTQGPTTEHWMVTATLVPQRGADWREVSALLRKLRGRLNKLRLFDPSRPMRGAGGAGPTLNIDADAVAGATSITVRGLAASQAVALAADDLIGIGENLYAVSADAASNANGEATIDILPPLRSGVADGDAVNTLDPTGLFHLVEGGNSGVVVPGDIRQPLTLEFIEAPDYD